MLLSLAQVMLACLAVFELVQKKKIPGHATHNIVILYLYCSYDTVALRNCAGHPKEEFLNKCS